ncbi:hypothetical protein D3C80_759440 [compost metagenome]
MVIVVDFLLFTITPFDELTSNKFTTIVCGKLPGKLSVLTITGKFTKFSPAFNVRVFPLFGSE